MPNGKETTPLPRLDATGLAVNADARFRHVFAEGFDPILLSDSQGQILDANREAWLFFGVDRRVLLAVNVRDIHVDGYDLPELADFEGGGAKSFQSKVVTRQRQGNRSREVIRTVEVRARRLTPGVDGTWQWIYHDISSEVELEEMRQDLITMLVHDLQSPLGNVISSLQLIQIKLESEEADASTLELLDVAEKSSEQLQRLIASLLDISRLEAGQPLGQFEPVDLAEIIDDVGAIVEPHLAQRQMALIKTLQDDLPRVSAEPNVIARVVLNLVDNALRYSSEGRQITVAAEVAPGNMVLVTVSDQGVGVPEKYRELIFEKFQRVKETAGSKGLGLGLAFCRLAIDAHGGRIWVDDAPGGGARFNFTLPLAGPTLAPGSQFGDTGALRLPPGANPIR